MSRLSFDATRGALVWLLSQTLQIVLEYKYSHRCLHVLPGLTTED